MDEKLNQSFRKTNHSLDQINVSKKEHLFRSLANGLSLFCIGTNLDDLIDLN